MVIYQLERLFLDILWCIDINLNRSFVGICLFYRFSDPHHSLLREWRSWNHLLARRKILGLKGNNALNF